MSDFTIAQIELHVHDIPRAVAFYRDILRLPLLVETPGTALFDCGPTRLMLSSAQIATGCSGVVYFDTPHIEDAFDRLKSHGVLFEREPHFVARMSDRELWIATFRDPDNNGLALLCKKQ